LGSKRRVAVAVLLFFQALVFGFYSLEVFLNSVSPPIVAYVEFLASFLTVMLGIFVLQGSRLALIVTTIASGIEVLLAVPLALLGAMGSGWGFFILIVILQLPLLPAGLLAFPTFILCVTMLKSGQQERSAPAPPTV
jgi:hypothetical protein